MATNVDSNPLKGFFYALAGTILLSTNFITAKYALAGFNPATFALIWAGSAALYSLIILLMTKGASLLILPRDSIWQIVTIGLFTGVGMLLGWTALSRLDPTFMAFLGRFRPILIIVLSFIFLGERLWPREMIPVSLMIVGTAYSAWGRWGEIGDGLLLALAGIFMAAGQQIVAKKTVLNAHPSAMVFYRVAIASVVIGIWNLISGETDFAVPRSYWLVLLLGALLGPTISFHMMYRAYKYWDLSRSSMVIIGQPVIVLPMAFIFLGYLPTIRELHGGLIILAGALLFGWMHFSKGKITEVLGGVVQAQERAENRP